jgi:hypothetical protein
MNQTIGSQIFGPWYDVLGWFVVAAVFIYFVLSAEGMPREKREKLPKFLLNKSTCVLIALIMVILGVGKGLKWW